MNVLMALAAVGAVGIGAYAEGAWVLVLFARRHRRWRRFALERSRRSVESLMELAPAQARVLDRRRRAARRRSTRSRVGARIVDPPGRAGPARRRRRRPARSSVDEAPITGESVPVDKQAGDEVFAGTLNTTGALVVARRRGRRRTRRSSRVAALVEEAQGSRAPSERFVDRFARVYTPLVFVAALLLATVPLLFGGDARHVALPRAGAADRRLPVLAGDLGPGRGRLGGRRRRARAAS